MLKNENTVKDEVTIAASKLGVDLLRNNSGAAQLDGRFVRFGLGNTSAKLNEVFKSSDLIGITPVKITADMVGKTLGIFTAIECKASIGGRRLKAQENFILYVKRLGGITGFAASVSEFEAVLKEALPCLAMMRKNSD